MYKISKTEEYEDWFSTLRDVQTCARINARLRRVETGNLGDVQPVGENVSEMRFFFGAGYRIYFIQQGDRLVILLGGGDKSTQPKDIKLAIDLANTLRGVL